MNKILATGASGFLGGRIVEFFQDKYEVFAPTHGEMDITKEENVREVLSKYKPDVVIHCAAISDTGKCEREPERAYEINVVGSVNLAKASKEIGAKCILCSSDQVYFGSTLEGAHKEEEMLQPFNAYGKGKLQAEEECLRVNPDCVLLRLSWMYDSKTLREGEHGDFLRTLREQLKTESELTYAIYDRRGITDVNEVIRNLEKTFQIPGGVYNFGAPNDKNMYDTIYQVFEKAGLDTGRLRKNEQAFKDNPRNLCMCQERVQKYGIFFLNTVEGLLRYFSYTM